MKLNNIRIKDVISVIKYRPTIAEWTAFNRRNHIIGIKISGSALHIMDKKSFVMSGGCVYFLNQKDDYRVTTYEFGESLSIHFTTDEEIETESFCLPIANVYEAISLLNKARVFKTAGNELKLLSVVYEFCDILEAVRTKQYFHQDPRLIEAKKHIDLNFTKEDCLKVAAEQSKLGERRFRDLYKQSFGITPSKYITVKKIEQAKDLLSAGGISITEISELCGFSDVYYFSKTFKQICGMPPSAWK